MPGASRALEDRIAELVAQGYNPAAAAAIATSKQPKDRNIRAIDSRLKKGAPKKGGRSQQPRGA